VGNADVSVLSSGMGGPTDLVVVGDEYKAPVHSVTGTSKELLSMEREHGLADVSSAMTTTIQRTCAR
jgi:hypothetical protein